MPPLTAKIWLRRNGLMRPETMTALSPQIYEYPTVQKRSGARMCSAQKNIEKRETLADMGYEPDGPNCFGPPSRAARLASPRHVLNPQTGPPLAGVLADPAPERHLFEEDRDTMGSSLRDDVASHGRVLVREAACAGGTILG